MVSYDLTTSMPEYADGTRGITQEDVDELNRILWKYEINTPNRIAHFLAQTYVESQRGFGRVERIITDGALYVGQNYYWESAGVYWSIGKPGTANDDRYDLNKKCDENASVEIIQ